MTDTIPDLAAALTEANSQRRDTLAAEIADRCADTTQPSAADARAVFEAIRASDGTVRQTLSDGLRELGKQDRAAVGPLVADLLAFLTDDPPGTRVRIDLARAAGSGVAADPASVDHGCLPALFSLLHDDERWVRHSAAWALELLAFARTMKVGPRATELAAHVDDPHMPVGKHVCRALAHVVRAHSLAGVPEAKVIDRLDLTDAAVRTAASVLLGAVGSEVAVSALRDRLSRESDPDVRMDLRHALREATFPGRVDAAPIADLNDPSAGEWLVVESRSVPLRTGRLRGRVEGHTADGGLEASNPYEGYTLTLQPDGEKVRYADRRTADDFRFRWHSLGTVPAWRIPLSYALEGDTLTVALERREYTLEVTAVEGGADSRRVTGVDDRGNTIEFRPSDARPDLARFRRGRCFEIESARLETGFDE